MPSRFAERFAALARPAFFHEFGVDVTYRRGGFSVALSALIDQTTFEQMQEMTSTTFETRDYLIEVSKLILNGTLIEPERGDLIVEGSKTYQVTTPAGGKAAAFEDENQLLYRVHTVLKTS